MTYIIAIDLGTTLIKCTLFDVTGRTLACQSIPCQLVHRAPLFVEQDPAFWYDGVCSAIKDILKNCDKQSVAGICIVSQGISVVPVDAMGQPLSFALSWLDARATTQCHSLQQLRSDGEWFRITGKFLNAAYTLPKLLWLQQSEPEIWRKTAHFLLPMDYVNLRMTGRAVTDPTMAAGTLCYHRKTNDWDEQILTACGIGRQRLAQIVGAGSLVGTINQETAEKTGLCTDTKVFCGGQDQKVAAYAASISSKRACLSLGTAGAMEIMVLAADEQMQLPIFPSVMGDVQLLEACINTTGAAIQWVKDTICSDLSYEQMNALAANAPIGSHGLFLYPHFSGPGTPHQGRSEFGSIHGLSLGVTRGDMVRALYEGLAYEIRLNLACAARAGSAVEELVVFGGGSKSAVLCQIISDVTGLRVLVTENSEMGSVGAAKLAMVGLGLDTAQFMQTTVSIAAIYEQHTQDYEMIYASYIKNYEG